MITAKIWPTLDYSRVPYRLYHDAEIYKREQERIRGGNCQVAAGRIGKLISGFAGLVRRRWVEDQDLG